jgi:hypothetical protein
VGDIHPLCKRQVARLLQALPEEYLYGLRAIELRPRQAGVGDPFGVYLNDENSVWIYSLPFPEWKLPPRSGASLYEIHGAEVKRQEDCVSVVWPRPVDLAYFVYREVLLHELGHHWHNRYRTKRPHPKSPAAKESSASRHADVLAELAAFRTWFEG